MEIKETRTYVLNTPVLTSYGCYDFWKITIEDVLNILRKGFISAIGHEATAQVMSRVVGIPIPTARIAITMGVGDIAVVFRLLERLPEGKVLSEKELEALKWEFGLLVRMK